VLVKDSGGLEPLTFSFLRFATAAAAFSPFLPEAIKDTSGTLLPAGLELGLWTSAGYLTQVIACQRCALSCEWRISDELHEPSDMLVDVASF